VQEGWIFKGRRGGYPFYIYLKDEDAAGIRAGQPGAVRFQALSSLSMSNRQLLNVVSSTDL
jgi:Cys-tRNA synthase (O-phospho-L-seryl-tRNA:Cys-tRNA synthase)